MIRWALIVFAGLSAMAPVPCGAERQGGRSAEERFFEANIAYKNDRFQEAVNGYLDLINDGFENGHIYFNLGNAYFRSNQLGKAILHYHKAQYFLPNDEDVRQNLEFASKKRVDPLIEEEKDSLFHTVDVTLKRVRYPYLFFSAFLFLMIAGLASIAMIVRREGNRPLGYVLVICGVVGLLLAGTAIAFVVRHFLPAGWDPIVYVCPY